MVRLLTLNIWGAPYSKHRPQRIRAIIDRIQILNPDIVALQEVYLADNRQQLTQGLKQIGYSYIHYFGSGVLGSGLLTASKYPVIDANFLRFRLGGKPDKILHGDYYVAKGVGMAEVKTPDGIVTVFNSHTHAQYEPHDDNEYHIFTDTNLYEIARFMQNSSTAVLCGDLNIRPDQRGYDIILQLGKLTDVWSQLHDDKAGVTFSTDNPYVESANQRLDYVMVRGQVAAKSIDIVMTEKISNYDDALAYSDHYGLLVDLDLQRQTQSNYQLSESFNTLRKLHQRLEDSVIEAQQMRGHYFNRLVLSTLGIVDGYVSAHFMRHFSLRLSRIMKWLILPISLGYAVFNMLQYLGNWGARLRVLESIRDEVKLQIDSETILYDE